MAENGVGIRETGLEWFSPHEASGQLLFILPFQGEIRLITT
jgi:hypothetical protein